MKGRGIVSGPPPSYEEFSTSISQVSHKCAKLKVSINIIIQIIKIHKRGTLHECLPPPTTIIVDESDMNPLKPCGACHEWLKKIAEFNPCFSVVTFTDVNCSGVYIEQIEG